MSVVATAQLHPQLGINQSSVVFDDFYNYTSGGLWTTLAASSGTTAASATTDQVILTTAASSSDYQGIWLTNPDFLFTSGVGMYAEAYVNLSSFVDPAIYFGFCSDPTQLASSTADPSGSYSGAIIYSLAGGSNFKVQASNGSAKTTIQSVNCPLLNGTVNPQYNHVLRVDVVNWNTTQALVTFSIDAILPKDVNGIQLQCQVPYASLAHMKVGAQIVSGGSADVLNVDYLGAGKYRQLLT